MNKNDIFSMRFGDFILILYPSLQESIYTVQSYFLPWQNDINLEQNGISNGYQIRCDNVAIHLNLCKWLRLKKLLLLYFKDAVDTRLLMVETWMYVLCLPAFIIWQRVWRNVRRFSQGSSLSHQQNRASFSTDWLVTYCCSIFCTC